jgi:DNA-binding LytR/AlgR family response regulator
MRAASAPANIASIDATTKIAMTTTEARIEVLAAAVRAMAQVLPPEQSAMASALFLRHVASLGREQLSDLADQAAAAEIVGVMMSLAR